MRTPNEVRADIEAYLSPAPEEQERLGELLTEHAFASRGLALRTMSETMKRWLTEEGDLGEGRINQICAFIWGGE